MKPQVAHAASSATPRRMAGSTCCSARFASEAPSGVRSIAESSKAERLFYQYFQRGTSRCSKAKDGVAPGVTTTRTDRKSTRLNSSHGYISYAVFCLKKKKQTTNTR